jgi:hypothetical protein
VTDMDGSPPATDRPEPDWEYLLKVDAQSEKYTELRQKLMYFLVTASIGIAAFAFHFYVGSIQGKQMYRKDQPSKVAFVLAIASALASAGSALLTVHLDHRSVARHLKCRERRETFDDLSDEDQRKWESINDARSLTLGVSFVALFAEVALLVCFFYPVVIK